MTGTPAAGEPPARPVAVCIVVPNGARALPLAAALATQHTDWDVGALWCGDPHRRPDEPVMWWDSLGPETAERERVLLQEPRITSEWLLVLPVVDALLRRGHAHVIVLVAGAVAVLDVLDPLVEHVGGVLTAVPLVIGELPDDGRSPTRADLERAGRCSADVLVAHAGAEGACAWIAGRLRATEDAAVGEVLASAVERFGGRVLDDERIGVSVWRWGSAAPSLLDLPGFDPAAPWLLAADMEGEGRLVPLADSRIERALASARSQLHGRGQELALPGGIAVDRIVRRAVREGLRVTGTMPAAWSQPVEFRRWLAPWFWRTIHDLRPDLATAFPDPTGTDADAFRTWQRRAWVDDSEVSVLVDVVATAAGRGPAHEPAADSTASRAADPYRPLEPLAIVRERRSDGVNLVGYLTREASLGDVARRLRTALHAAEVPVAAIASDRTASPLLAEPPAVERTVRFDTTLAVITADQFPVFARDRPELVAATRRMIGYWFWELEAVPRSMRDALALVDEVWVGSTFVQRAFAAVTGKPVRHVPIPIPRPVPAERARDELSMLADVGERFVFLVVFDHLSITERKNPIGAIQAFRRAFPPSGDGSGAGPVLVVKSMNGTIRWRQQQAVLAAAAGHPDVRCVDEAMSKPELMALVRAADCLVSLHRSEGLGLHLAEAMWLGTPTIATRYSGNLDFMGDDCALLIDARMTRVGNGGQGVYPSNATWADPDVDQAAEAMRTLAADPRLARRLANAALARMHAQPTLTETGRTVATLLGLRPAAGGTVTAR